MIFDVSEKMEHVSYILKLVLVRQVAVIPLEQELEVISILAFRCAVPDGTLPQRFNVRRNKDAAQQKPETL